MRKSQESQIKVLYLAKISPSTSYMQVQTPGIFQVQCYILARSHVPAQVCLSGKSLRIRAVYHGQLDILAGPESLELKRVPAEGSASVTPLVPVSGALYVFQGPALPSIAMSGRQE
jgi:hypothetical protein